MICTRIGLITLRYASADIPILSTGYFQVEISSSRQSDDVFPLSKKLLNQHIMWKCCLYCHPISLTPIVTRCKL